MARLDGKDRGLFERPKDSGVWWIRYTDAEGAERREKVGGKTAAKQLYNKRKDEARRGKKLGPLNQRPLTVKDALEKYLPEMTATKKAKGKQAAQKHFDTFSSAFGEWTLTELKAGDIESWKVKQLTEKAKPQHTDIELWKANQIRRGRKVTPEKVAAWKAWREKTKTPATVNRSLSFLKRVLSLAVRDQLLDSNPLAQGRVKMLRENNRRERFLTQDEEARLSTLARSFVLAIGLALHTGLRQGEQFGLTRQTVDLRRKFIKLTDTKAGEVQTLRLNPVAVAILTEILASHQSEYVFPGRYGKGHIRGTSVAHRFQRACKKLKIEGASWHTLRHTFISRLCMLGVPLPTVQKLARHKSITMTLRYSHLCPDHEEESLNNLAASYPSALRRIPSPAP